MIKINLNNDSLYCIGGLNRATRTDVMGYSWYHFV